MKKNMLLVVFIFATIALGSFVIYDKVLNKNNDVKCRIDNKEDNSINELKKYFDGYDKLGIEVMLENYYLKYLPDSDKSFDVNNLSDNDISMSVWKYIYLTSGGFTSSEISRTKGEIDDYLEKL